MQGYLLDTNIISYWFDDSRPQHGRVVKRIADLPPETPLRISAVTLGEIEYGRSTTGAEDRDARAEVAALMEHQLPAVIDIRRSTAVYYGPLRARLFNKFAPKALRKARWPEQCIDPATSLELGVQENDLWIAAQAIEHNLTLVTHDKMSRLREVIDGGSSAKLLSMSHAAA